MYAALVIASYVVTRRNAMAGPPYSGLCSELPEGSMVCNVESSQLQVCPTSALAHSFRLLFSHSGVAHQSEGVKPKTVRGRCVLVQ